VFIVFGWCGRTFVFGFVSRCWVRRCFGLIKHSYLGCVKFMMICGCVQFYDETLNLGGVCRWGWLDVFAICITRAKLGYV
jgi:hypothetical protein